MTDKIKELKTALRNELKKELREEKVRMNFNLTSKGF